jgi:serine/threonine protein kinase
VGTRSLKEEVVSSGTSGHYVGRYRLLKKIASGGMGEVHLASATGPEGFLKVVVLKRILSSAAGDEDYLRMFLHEARLVAKLSHRNIAQIHDLGQDQEGFYVVMEYVKGPSVRRLLDVMARRRERFLPGLAIDVCAQVAEALAYAHSATDEDGHPLRIVHRDVTPDNILVSVSGDVKLIDFGVAKSAVQQHASEAGSVKGKISYMSPEQSQGRAIDARSDIFSLGIVLCEMLSGRNPFAHRGDVVRTAMAIQQEDPRLPSADEPRLAIVDAVLQQMLAKRPEHRFEDANKLFEQLNALRAQMPSPATRLGPFVAHYFGEEISNLIKSVSDPEVQEAMSASPEVSSLLVESSPTIATHAERTSKARGQRPDAGGLGSDGVPTFWLPARKTAIAAGLLATGLLGVAAFLTFRHRTAEPAVSASSASEAPFESSPPPLAMPTPGATRLGESASPLTPPTEPDSQSPRARPAPLVVPAPSSTMSKPVALGRSRSPSKQVAGPQGGEDKNLRARFARVKAAWLAERSKRSEEDVGIFDLTLKSIEEEVKQGSAGEQVEARRNLDEFVRSALRGEEP